jgi:hypothetical protein
MMIVVKLYRESKCGGLLIAPKEAQQTQNEKQHLQEATAD